MGSSVDDVEASPDSVEIDLQVYTGRASGRRGVGHCAEHYDEVQVWKLGGYS